MSKLQVLALTTKSPRFWASSTKHVVDPSSTTTTGQKQLPPEQVGTSSAPGSPRKTPQWRKMRTADSPGKGEGREGEGSQFHPKEAKLEAGSNRQSSEEEQRQEERLGGRRGSGPTPCPAHTHRRGTVTGVGVVLDFPQALVEAFSLVWFPVFVFVLFVREQIFRAQEGAGERQSRGEAGAEAEPGGGSEAALTSRGCRRRRWGTCSGGVSRRRPRCHRSERKPKAAGGQRQR